MLHNITTAFTTVLWNFYIFGLPRHYFLDRQWQKQLLKQTKIINTISHWSEATLSPILKIRLRGVIKK